MREKIYETVLGGPVDLKGVKKNLERKLKRGYFHKWGEFKYRWGGRKNILYIGNKNWSGKISFLKTKLAIDLDLPIVGKIPGEILFEKSKKIVFWADIPFLAKLFVFPIMKKIAKEIKNILIS